VESGDLMARKQKKVKKGGHRVKDSRTYGLMHSGVLSVRGRNVNPNGGQLAAPIIRSIESGHLDKRAVFADLHELCREMSIDPGTRTQMYNAINKNCPD